MLGSKTEPVVESDAKSQDGYACKHFCSAPDKSGTEDNSKIIFHNSQWKHYVVTHIRIVSMRRC